MRFYESYKDTMSFKWRITPLAQTRVLRRSSIIMTIMTFLILAGGMCPIVSGGSARAGQQDLDKKIGKKENELESLRNQIAEQRKKIGELEKKEKDVSEYLRKLEAEGNLGKRLLDGLDEKKGMLEQQVDLLRDELTASEADYARRLKVFSKRLREMYKNGSRQAWMELLAAEDVADLLQRYKFVSLIAERDADLIEGVRRHREEVARTEAGITEALHEVTVSRNEKEGELEKLKENERKRRRTLSGLKSDRRKYEQRVAELAAAESQISTMLEELEKIREEQSKAWGDYGVADFNSLKGRLARPVSGETTRRFGRFKHPEFGTVTYNTGIDISTRTGEPVRSVARGRVEFAGVLPGYGNCIIINHGGGFYTMYAHASQIFVQQGGQVENGGLIAETGEETAGAGGLLHFEIRQSKKALDPEGWLRKGGR
ncbi:MAG: peptidoglycan DD-metalloendopeptidase family protein [Bacteroidales bacterium]|nr:peptidoglycan DD-metalloendopeptidase family protein [Candidatus Latescibacterota bacterium]